MGRALYITHKEIFPVVGGDQVRFSQQLSLLADRFEVDLLSLTHSPATVSPYDYEPRLHDALTLYVPRLRRYMRASCTLVNGLPEVVNHYRDPRVAAFVRDHAGDYDVVLCGSTAMARYFPPRHPAALLDMTDSLAMNYRNAALRHAGPKRLWLLEEARRMTRWERACRDRFRKVAYISEIDCRYVDYRPEKTVIVGNYVNLPAAQDCCTHEPDNRIISFVGRMDYPPNVQAVAYFADLWRRGVKDYADSFDIVGGYAGAGVKALAGDGISLKGFVPSLSTVFRDSALVVAPMLSGSGIQNKILQAMAHGCCVLTTPIGAEGLDPAPGAFVVAAPGEEFARAVAELMGNTASRREFGERARRYVADNFSREAIGRQFDDFLN